MQFSFDVKLFEKHKQCKKHAHSQKHKLLYEDKHQDYYPAVDKAVSEMHLPPSRPTNKQGVETTAVIEEVHEPIEAPAEEILQNALYFPIGKEGRFVGITLGTTVTVYTENSVYPALTGYFQGIISDAKEETVLILANGNLFRIPVIEINFVTIGS
ncbi:hypothetical protein CEQ21_02995 [Niallia circulans]|uniref:Uncharacterized protein n=2 Tax=Niallia circulans TaxID=1397 RepID=A0A553SSE9_NIACI|nr:hypothetical protein CEQ21_02995 [Niallia circulans]